MEIILIFLFTIYFDINIKILLHVYFQAFKIINYFIAPSNLSYAYRKHLNNIFFFCKLNCYFSYCVINILKFDNILYYLVPNR